MHLWSTAAHSASAGCSCPCQRRRACSSFSLQAPRPVPPVMRGARKRVARRGSMSHEAFQVNLTPLFMSDAAGQVSAFVLAPRQRRR